MKPFVSHNTCLHRPLSPVRASIPISSLLYLPPAMDGRCSHSALTDAQTVSDPKEEVPPSPFASQGGQEAPATTTTVTAAAEIESVVKALASNLDAFLPTDPMEIRPSFSSNKEKVSAPFWRRPQWPGPLRSPCPYPWWHLFW